MFHSPFSQETIISRERKRILRKGKQARKSPHKQNRVDSLERSIHTEKTHTSLENSLSLDDGESKSSSLKSIEVPYSWREHKDILRNRVIEIHGRYSPSCKKKELQNSNQGLTIVNPILIPPPDVLQVRKRLQSCDSWTCFSSFSTTNSTTSSVNVKRNDCPRVMNTSDAEDLGNSLSLMSIKSSGYGAKNVEEWGHFVDASSEENQQGKAKSYRRFMSKELSCSKGR